MKRTQRSPLRPQTKKTVKINQDLLPSLEQTTSPAKLKSMQDKREKLKCDNVTLEDRFQNVVQ